MGFAPGPGFALLRIRWQARINPRVESAIEWMHVLPTAIREFLCHTGTGPLARSSAVSDDSAVVRNLVEMLAYLIGRHSNGVWQLQVRLPPRLRISRINKRERLTTINPLANLVDCDSCSFHSM